MLLSRHQNVGQNRDIKIANRSFENVSQLKYLGTTVTNQNMIKEEIKRWFYSDNVCYHSVQKITVVLSNFLPPVICLESTIFVSPKNEQGYKRCKIADCKFIKYATLHLSQSYPLFRMVDSTCLGPTWQISLCAELWHRQYYVTFRHQSCALKLREISV
jgi:hypothetical protein